MTDSLRARSEIGSTRCVQIILALLASSLILVPTTISPRQPLSETTGKESAFNPFAFVRSETRYHEVCADEKNGGE